MNGNQAPKLFCMESVFSYGTKAFYLSLATHISYLIIALYTIRN